MPDELAGVLDIVNTEERGITLPPETKTEPQPKPAEEPKPKVDPPKEEKPKPAEAKPEASEEEEEKVTDTQDFSREPDTEEEEEAPVETKTEPSKTETETNPKTEEPVDDWKKSLAPPPPPYAGKKPELNEEGQIINMTQPEYEEYLISTAEDRLNRRNYDSYVENAGLDAAEKILPEIKTNATVRQLVENQRIAQVVNGQAGDVVTAARAIKQIIAPTDKALADAKAEGARGAKTSITIQKQAAVETGAAVKKPEASLETKLNRRLNRGDDTAFAELLDLWAKDGKI